MISETLQANLLGAGHELCDPYTFLMFQLYVIVLENVTFSLGEHNGKIGPNKREVYFFKIVIILTGGIQNMTEEPQKSPEELIESMEEAQQPISRADVKEEFAVQSSQGNKTVSIVAIIAGAVVLLGCILACAVVAYAITLNPPW